MRREPPPNVRYWSHVRTGRVCWTDIATNEVVFADGDELDFSALESTALQARGYVESNAHQWNRSTERAHSAALRRVRKLPSRFYLVTTRALVLWDRSMQKVLRVMPSAEYPRGVVGLLMSVAS